MTTGFAAPLAAVVEREAFREALDGLCRSWGWGAPREVRVRVLKAHERRCVFEIAVRTGGGWRELIAKTYRRERADVFRAMTAIAGAGFGPEAACSIPQPRAYLSDLGLRLEEKAPGRPAKDIFVSGTGPQRISAAERCARWLARFQAAAPPAGAPIPGAEPRRWEGWVADLAGFGAPLAGRAQRLLRGLTAAMPVPGTVADRAAHGSYIPAHVLLSDGRTVAIDLDRCGVADPAREVAGFVVALQRLALKSLGSFRELDGAAEAFLRAYAAASRRNVMPRVGFYRAVECLRRGRRDVHGRTPPALDRAALMLDAGLRALTPGPR